MIISQTPYRISFFGGGTDYPDWYLRCGGQVLSATIDKYIYISCRYLPPFFNHKLRLAYSRVETCQTVDELEHPAVREILKYFNIDNGLEIHYDGDLPARSGMGSSSAFSVGLINSLYSLLDKSIHPHQLALEAIHIEQELIGESVGSQDQINAAYGGFNHICFSKDGSIEVFPLKCSLEKVDQLTDNLMLFYTGIMRTAETISVTYAKNTQNKAAQLEKIHQIVDQALEIINGDQSLDNFGELLHQTWLEKRALSQKVSNSRVDNIYEIARNAGALGGKLCGAGGGGMILFYVPTHYQSKVRDALSSLLHIPFKFATTGSKIIYKKKQEDFKDAWSNRSSMIDPFRELSDL